MIRNLCLSLFVFKFPRRDRSTIVVVDSLFLQKKEFQTEDLWE